MSRFPHWYLIGGLCAGAVLSQEVVAQTNAATAATKPAPTLSESALNVADTDIPRAIKVLDGQPESLAKTAALEAVAKYGAWHDPQVTAKAVLGMNPGLARNETLKVFGYAWGAGFPEDALDWFLLLPAGEDRDALASSIISCVGGSQPDYAVAVLGEFTDPKEKQAVVKELLRNYVGKHPGKLAEFLEVFPEGSPRRRAKADALRTIAINNPKLALEQLGPVDFGPQQMDLVTRLVSGWAINDPRGAVAWLSSFPMDKKNTRVLTMAFESVAGDWAEVDPQAALAWASALPEGKLRTSALTQIAHAFLKWFPQRAFSLMAGDPTLATKSNGFSFVVKTWKAADPEMAIAAVNASALPEDLKVWLLTAKAN